MKRVQKKALVSVLCAGFIFLLIWDALRVRTVTFEGVIQSGENQESAGYAVLEYRNIHKWFGFRWLNGKLTVCTNQGGKDIVFAPIAMLPPAPELDRVYAASASGYDPYANSFLAAYIYFDDHLSQVVCVTERFLFVSAEEAVVEKIKDLNSDWRVENFTEVVNCLSQH